MNPIPATGVPGAPPRCGPRPSMEAPEDVLLQRRRRRERLEAALDGLRQEAQAWPAPAEMPPSLRRACQQRRALRTWRRGAGWAMAAAAASLAALAWMGPGAVFGNRAPRLARFAPAGRAAGVAGAAAPLLATAMPVPSAAASASAGMDFLPLAAAMPASGFVVRVNLPAADLASLGIAAAPEGGTVPAEVLMSDEGVPCGIRFLAAPGGTAGAAAGPGGASGSGGR